MAETPTGRAETREKDTEGFLFANLKQQLDNMIAICHQTNEEYLTHAKNMNSVSHQAAQNAITAANQANLNGNFVGLARMIDEIRLAREMEVGESLANRLLAEVAKLGTTDYLTFWQMALSYLAEIEAAKTAKE